MWRRAAWFIGGSLTLYAVLVVMDHVSFLRWDPVAAAHRILASTDREGSGGVE